MTVGLTSAGKRNGEASGLSHSASGDRHDHSLESSCREPRLNQLAILHFVDGQRSCGKIGGWRGIDENDTLVRQQQSAAFGGVRVPIVDFFARQEWEGRQQY